MAQLDVSPGLVFVCWFVSSARLGTAHAGWVGDVWGEEKACGGCLGADHMQNAGRDTGQMWLKRERYSRGRGPSMSQGVDTGLSWRERGRGDAGIGGRWCRL